MNLYNLKQVWDKTLPLLKKNVGESNFEIWMKYLKPYEVQNNIMRFKIPNEILKNILQDRFKGVIEESLTITCQRKMRADFFIEKFEIDEEPDEVIFFHPNLNPKYTFDNFVVGGGNNLAHSAALSICEKPGGNYNPFFIYGGVGLGKTHLMQAIGNQAFRNNKNLKVLYVSSELFTNELVNSIREGDTENFRKKYRDIDILLIDDIQFIAGKAKTEEEFFHTFNTLHQMNKQIVLTSDKPPNEIGYMESRLISRFASGLCVDIQPPDLETRMAILQKKRHVENLSLSDEVLKYIAENIRSNVRNLEGAMVKINANQALVDRELNLDEAKIILRDMLENREKVITHQNIKEFICDFYSVSIEDLNSKKRLKSIAEPRQIAMYLTRELTDMSLIKIGEAFFRDHSTVVYAVEKVEQMIEDDPIFDKQIEEMKKYIVDNS